MANQLTPYLLICHNKASLSPIEQQQQYTQSHLKIIFIRHKKKGSKLENFMSIVFIFSSSLPYPYLN